MNNLVRNRVRLTARNEGKIKSYESCVDLRAWSHDIGRRNCYLRDWIKSDMRISVIPVCTLASIMGIMTCRHRGKLSPRCNPDCKSKIVLDSICASCNAIKDCLGNSAKFDTYFYDEEFETCHWPCERCLEILKSVRMFWRIIIEKVFKISLPQSDHFQNMHRTDSIRSIAKVWEKEIIQQAILVKSGILIKHNEDIDRFDKICDSDQIMDTTIYFKNKGTETECEFRSVASQKDGIPMRKKICKCTSVNIKTNNASCQTCSIEKEHKGLKTDVIEIGNMLQKQHFQKFEVDRLKRENVALKIELNHIRGNRSKNSLRYDPSTLSTVYDGTGLASKPFDRYSEEAFDLNTAKDLDSEMIITVKNCKHETFRHVSLLQVLHKTNGPIIKFRGSETCCNNEDPIQLLNKVHKTFGAIVSREMSIANKSSSYKKNKDIKIKATYRKLDVCNSAPSCSTVTSCCDTSHSNFESASDIQQNRRSAN